MLVPVSEESKSQLTSLQRTVQRGAIVVSRTPEHWQNANTTMADRDVTQESEQG
jgi:hypothetical protein